MRAHAAWFRIASLMGMTIGECQTRMSQREFKAWCQWIREDQNEPSRADHYIMQLTAELRLLRYGLSNNRKPITLSEFRIPFGEAPLRAAETPDSAKRRWFGILGMTDGAGTSNSKPDR